jgi:hypothetical protein
MNWENEIKKGQEHEQSNEPSHSVKPVGDLCLGNRLFRGNDRRFSSHKGANAILCPVGDFANGVYVVKVAGGLAENVFPKTLIRTIMLTN